MSQRSSAPARALAVAALLGGVVVLIVVIATSVGDGGDGGGSGGTPAGQVKQAGENGEAPKAYVVQNGDTLTSIAHKTGVAVSRIEELNPGVDPQILVSGEKLKLR